MEAVERLVANGQAAEGWRLGTATIEKLPPGSEAERFLAEMVPLALHYFAHEEAEKWIETYRERTAKRGALTSYVEELLRGLQLAVLLATKQYSEARRIEGQIRWDRIGELPWAVNLHLLCSVHRGNRPEVLEVLKSAPPCPRPFDRGNRFRILALHYLNQSKPERCLSLCRAALCHFGKAPRLLSRLREIEIHCLMGRAYYDSSHYDRAEEEFRKIREARELYHDTRLTLRFSQELAWILAHRGQFAQARQLLDSLPLHPARTLDDVFCRVRLLETRASLAIEAEDRREASSHLDQAQAILDKFPHRRRQAYIYLGRARLECHDLSTDESYRRAVEYFDRAEECFAQCDTGDPYGRSLLTLGRGELFLARRVTPKAIECCVQAMELAEARGFLDIRARGLLLKSCLLVERGLPAADRVYEEVIRELGLVRNSALLFKVIANLYLYTWQLKDGLEWTDHHMRQLIKFKQILDRDVFDRLYRKYVVQRVLRRGLWDVFGVDPEFLPDDE